MVKYFILKIFSKSVRVAKDTRHPFTLLPENKHKEIGCLMEYAWIFFPLLQNKKETKCERISTTVKLQM